MVSPWKTGFGNSTFSNPRLPTVVPSVVSPTERPTATPSVKRLLTSGLPNSACAAAWKSTCNGCGFIVRQENHTLSASVTVRPGWCRKVCPISSSSKYFPATSGLRIAFGVQRLTAVVPDSINERHGKLLRHRDHRRRHHRSRHGAGPGRALAKGATRRAREGSQARHPPDRQQLGRHPFGHLLQAGLLQGQALRRG